jgi:HK97 gp10 family phage protein
MANNLNFGGAGGIKINGAKEIWVKMAKVGRVVATKLSKRALTKALKPVVARAKQLAPVQKDHPLGGMLRDSIAAKVTSKQGVIRGVAGPIRNKVRVGTRKKGKHKGQPIFKDPARYAHLQEFGTRHHKANPFLRPAWNEVGAEKALEVYTQELNKSLDEEVAKIK